MTIAPHWLDELYTSSALAENPRTLDRYRVEAVGTFGLILTVGVALCRRRARAHLNSANSVWHLAIGIAVVAGAFTAVVFLTVGSAAR